MIVLDCNAAIAIAQRAAAGEALEWLMLDGERAIAPSLFKFELANVLGKYVRGGYVSRQEAMDQCTIALSLVDEFCDMEDDVAEVLVEAIHLGHSAYDMFYFVLARRHAATLFTLDKKLQRLCEENGVDCVCEDSLA